MALGGNYSGMVQPLTAMAMNNNSEVVALLQKAISDLDMFKRWSEKAFLKGQELNLHGEKRRERDFITDEEYCITKDLQSKAIDVFKVTLEPEEKRLSFEGITNWMTYFEAVKNKVWMEYADVHKIVNDLIVAGWKPLTHKLCKWYECLFDIGIELNRALTRGNLTGWNPHDVLIYQTHWNNVHDFYEKHYKGKY